MEAAAEDVGLPDLRRVALELLQEVVDHVFALLFIADDGRNGRFDVGADDMQARRARLEPHAVAPALLHDLRLLQVQLVDRRHNDAVASLARIGHRLRHLVVLRLDRRELGEKTQQIAVILHIEARLLAQRPVKQCARELQFRRGDARAELNGRDARAADAFAAADGADRALHLSDTVEAACVLADGLIEAAFDRVIVSKRLDPRRDEEVQLAERELVKDGLENHSHCVVVERQAVDGQTCHAIA